LSKEVEHRTGVVGTLQSTVEVEPEPAEEGYRGKGMIVVMGVEGLPEGDD
jgi:hypothetical protein